MEQRKITIVSSSEQKKYVILSSAETLAQLKADLNENNIHYGDMEFMEGLSRTTLVDDNSQLPRDVVRTNRQTGETTTTNELVFMLTSAQKKIKSGVECADRRSCYSYIKEHGLQDTIKKTFDVPYTNVTTEALQSFIRNIEMRTQKCECKCEGEKECKEEGVKNILVDLIHALIDSGIFYTDTEEVLIDILSRLKPFQKEKKEIDSPYSDDEIEEMFDF